MLRPVFLLAFAALLIGCEKVELATKTPARPVWTAQKTSLSPDVVSWAKWLAEHTDILEAKAWKRTRTEVFVPRIWDGAEVGAEQDVLLAPDGKSAYTFDGVRVRVKGTLPVPQSSRGLIALRLPRGGGPGEAAVLLALGRTKEAEACSTEQTDAFGNQNIQSVLGAHAWHRHDAAIAALMRGDDIVGLQFAELLLADDPSLRKTIGGLSDHGGLAGDPAGFLSYLDDLPALVADLRRRTSAPHPQRDRQELAKTGDIAALIASLEDHNSRQMGQPGGVNSTDDPVLQALVAKGDAAVPSLLDTVEKDRRLTRAVGFARDFFPGRTILSVAGIARTALGQIAGVELFPGERRADGTSDPKAIRAFFAKNLGKTQGQRALAVLQEDLPANDEMGWQRYDAAATRLTDAPSTIRNGPYSQGARTDLFGPKTPWRADELAPAERSKLISLLDRRAEEIRTKVSAPTSSMDTSMLAVGLRLAVVRGLLEPKGALPPLRSGTAVALSLAKKEFYAPYADNFTADLAATFLLRARLGDRDAYSEYLAWLQASDFDRGFGPEIVALAPLRDADRDPRYAPILRWVTESPASPWKVRGLQSLAQWERRFGRYGGPMPAPIRRTLLGALKNRKVLATAHFEGRMLAVKPIAGAPYKMGIDPREKSRKPGRPGRSDSATLWRRNCCSPSTGGRTASIGRRSRSRSSPPSGSETRRSRRFARDLRSKARVALSEHDPSPLGEPKRDDSALLGTAFSCPGPCRTVS